MKPSKEYIDMICRLYGEKYDDREEDSAPGGLDWEPGKKAIHKSLAAFRKELAQKGIELSTSKIRKILITGGCWSTERSREVGYLHEDLIDKNFTEEEARKQIAKELEITPSMVSMLLPYDRVVYDVPGKSSNAVRCDRWRVRSREEINASIEKLPKEKRAQFDEMKRLFERLTQQEAPDHEKIAALIKAGNDLLEHDEDDGKS